MYHNASLTHWLLNNNKKIFIPAHADIDLSNACNQDCFYCNSVDFRKKFSGQPKHTTYIKLLDQLSTWREHSSDSYGTLHTITYPGGGEPTLLKHYEQVIEHTIANDIGNAFVYGCCRTMIQIYTFHWKGQLPYFSFFSRSTSFCNARPR